MKEKGKMTPSQISKAFAIGSLVVPIASHAFAVGDVDVRSFLNQKLKAELSININNDEQVLGVALASSERYKEQGLIWQPYLSDLRLNLKEGNGNGSKAIVEITSKTGMNEPMLDILVEIKIGNGVYYEEVAIALDPMMDSPVEAAVRQVKPAAANGTAKSNKSSKHSSNAGRVASESIPHADIALSGETYGPVATSETLLSIAKRIAKTAGASPNQVMYALYEGNPDAFYKNNINYLKANSTLRLSSDYGSVSKPQADKWFSEQMDKKSSASVSPALKLVVPHKDEVSKAIDSAKARIQSGGQSDASVNLADENAIRMQIASIEHEIKRTQELLNIKQIELNKIGGHVDNNGDNNKVETKPVAVVVDTKPVEPVGQKPTEANPVESKPVEVKPTETKPVEVKPVEVSNVQPAETKPVETNPVEPVAVKTTRPVVTKPVDVKPVVPVSTAATESEGIPDYLLYGGGGVIALFVGFMLWRVKTLKKMDDEFAASHDDHVEEASNLLIVDDSSENLAPNFNSSSSIDYKLAEDSSFLQDFTNTDFAEFDSGDNDTDAMTEADVYIAYGRYDHAESLIKESVLENPENDKLKLKLFEVYHISGNADKFEKFAKEMKAQGKHNDFNFWPKVLKMGKEVCPESPLFNLDKEEDIETKSQHREPINLFKPLDDDQAEEDDVITFESLESNHSDIDFTKEKLTEAASMFGVEFSLDDKKPLYDKDEATSAITEAASMFSLGKSIDDIVDNLDEIDFKGGDSHTINFESNLFIDTTFSELDDEK